MSITEEFCKIMPIELINITIVENIFSEESTKSETDKFVYRNDLLEEKVDDNKIIMKISEYNRFKIKSPLLTRPIETFKVSGDDFFKTVAKFHLPCVRAYYTGDNVYMTPTFITSMMLNVNTEYKYFSGQRDPVEILNKYRIRGFGTLINEKEKDYVFTYNKNNERYSRLFELEKVGKQGHMSHKYCTAEMYKPLKYLGDNHVFEYKKNDNIKKIMSLQHLMQEYTTSCGYEVSKQGLDIFKFKTISKPGKISPLKKWIIEAYWDMINN